MDVETTVTGGSWIAKFFFFGDLEYQAQVNKFYSRLVNEIETQHKKKVEFMDGVENIDKNALEQNVQNNLKI